MRNRAADEHGMALLVVMVLMGVMLTTGFALASTVDTQTGASRTERVRDSAFNLAESALNAQIFAMSGDWPGIGQAGTPYLPCTQASTHPPPPLRDRCPYNATLTGGGSPDLAGATWETSVRDNGAGSAPDFYSDNPAVPQLGYDKNKDGKVWVRARAVAGGKPRTLVALVRAEKQEEDAPRAALLAGKLDLSNNGNKELIDANNGLVAVRCTPTLLGLVPCLGHGIGSGKYKSLGDLLGFLTTQITGATPITGYDVPGPAMTAEARERLKATAIADGSYYDKGCPPADKISGAVVYIAFGACSYKSNTQFNSAQVPGVLIVENGSISFDGTSNYFGVVYAANTGNTAGLGVKTQGNAQVTGGVLIDGDAQMVVGSSGLNIEFDLNAYRALSSYGSAGVIQNTFREIKAG